MSNFDFIRLPEKLIQEKYKELKYRGNIVMPERLEKIIVGYEDWIKRYELPDDEKSMKLWRMNVSSQNIQESFISPIMKSKYNAELNWAFGGMCKGGCFYIAYLDNDLKYLYFYTMNRWKRIHDKFYRIIIYRIPYEIYDMLCEQDLYETYLYQNPSGFKFKIMTHEQCLENKLKYLKMDIMKNKEIIWR